MIDRKDVVDGLIMLKRFIPSTMWEPINDAIALLKEQETMNVDTFMKWCIDSHIMGDATVGGIEYWVEKFKEGR